MTRALALVAVVCTLALVPLSASDAPTLSSHPPRGGTQPVAVTIDVDGWYDYAWNGSAWILKRVHITIDDERLTVEGAYGIDPGMYTGTRTVDTVWITAYDLHGTRNRYRYRVVSHTWLTSIRH